MFTGLVEEIGQIKGMHKASNSMRLTISASNILKSVKLGDSIAVNGVCLTVTSFSSSEFTVDVMPETIRMSSLKELGVGSKVNLERAMALGDRFGGHIVSGHIDGTGTIEKIQEEEIAIWFTIKLPKELSRYIIHKGSIAVDGISLTCAEVGEDYFKVSIIPHTKDKTILSSKKAGDTVNLECDVIGKYVEKLFRKEEKKSNSLTENFLKENGFF
ncbi:MAG: riboflavin synthase [Bacillota bacterium]|nr:riboflavin synthase [Bacillota bacterium]